VGKIITFCLLVRISLRRSAASDDGGYLTPSGEKKYFDADAKSCDADVKTFDADAKTFDDDDKTCDLDAKTFDADAKIFEIDAKSCGIDVKSCDADAKFPSSGGVPEGRGGDSPPVEGCRRSRRGGLRRFW